VLVAGNPEPFLGAVKQALRSRGYAEGRNLQVEVRSAGGKLERLPALAAELASLGVDVLIGWQTPSVHALKQASAVVPIVMLAGDPVATGVVASLARPGGNITGVSSTTAALGGKTLELVREALPSAKRVAVLANAADPFARPFLAQLRDAGPQFAMEMRPWIVRGLEAFDAAFAELVHWRPDALVVQPSLPRDRAAALALKHRYPAISPTRLFPEAGGLMSYAASIAPLYGEVASYIDRILRGAKPGDLPVQQPATFELVLNLKTASALGIKLPRALLLRADKVIE
jgi:putative ABC transport system substrate-binding protein